MQRSGLLAPSDTCPKTRQDVLGRTPPSLEGVSCPFGMSCQQWQHAVNDGWLGMTTEAVARLGVRASWKAA